MANKKNFVLRIDLEVYKALEKWAGDEFRSVNGQIEWLINRQLRESGKLKKGLDVNAEKQPDSKK
jgi:hypothetical protein